MFVGSHNMHIFGVSPRNKSTAPMTNFYEKRQSMTNLQFLGSLIDDANKKKLSDPKRKVKGILKNATSMPNLAANSDQLKIDHKQLKRVLKRHKNPNNNTCVRKSVQFNDPVGRIHQLETKYNTCLAFSNTDEISLRKDKKLRQISLRNAQPENKNDKSNVLVTVVYDLKIKENKLVTSGGPEKRVSENPDKDTHNTGEVNENDKSDSTGQKQNLHKYTDANDDGILGNCDTYLAHTIIAPSLPNAEKLKSPDKDVQCQNEHDSADIKHQQTKPKDNVIVTRSRAKPVMFTRCVNNTSIPLAEDPVHKTNFCDDEKTTDIMRWLQDVKNEQERSGFCTLLISDGENKY